MGARFSGDPVITTRGGGRRLQLLQRPCFAGLFSADYGFGLAGQKCFFT